MIHRALEREHIGRLLADVEESDFARHELIQIRDRGSTATYYLSRHGI